LLSCSCGAGCPAGVSGLLAWEKAFSQSLTETLGPLSRSGHTCFSIRLVSCITIPLAGKIVK
jgi:hypothetical protein